MPLNLSKTVFTFSVSVLLVAASLTPSDARSHTKREAPPQSEPSNYLWDFDSARDRDSSCASAGLRNECSTHGGG
jgi:hypothetical protein